MADKNPDLGNILNTLKSVGWSPTPAKPSNYLKTGGYAAPASNYLGAQDNVYTPYEPVAPTTAAGTPLEALQKGGMNLGGYLLGLLTTAPSAGVAQTYYQHMTELEKKFQEKDYLGAIGEGLSGTADMVWGGIKGIADSIFPDFDKVIKNVDSRPIPKSFYDVLNGESYKKYAENKPVLKELTNDKPWFTWRQEDFLGNPEWDINLPVTSRGVTASVLDVFAEPISYLTLGVGGALKGVIRGTADVAKYAKAGKPANIADIPNVKPRPFYGKKEVKKTPIDVLPYNVTNVSPISYIAREVGRGFVESHRYYNLRSMRRLAAGKSNVAAVQTLAEIAKSDKNITGEKFVAESTKQLEALIAKEDARLAQTISDPAQRETLLAPMRENMAELIRQITENPDVVKRVLTTDVQGIASRATQDGVQPMESALYRLADEFAISIPRRTKLIQPIKEAKVDYEAIRTLGDSFANIARGKYEGDINYGAAFKDFLAKADLETMGAAVKSLIMPIGHRELYYAKKFNKEANDMNRNANLVEAVYGTTLNALGRGNRKVDTSMTAETVASGAKGQSRVEYRIRNSKEMQKILGVLKGESDVRLGAGSQTTRAKRIKIGEQDILNAPAQFLDALAREYYNAQKAAGAIPANSPEWTKLDVTSRKQAAVNMLNNIDKVTPEMFNAAMPVPTVMAIRLQYLAERAQLETTPIYEFFKNLGERSYNPLTAQARSPLSTSFALRKEEIKGTNKPYLSEVASLMNKLQYVPSSVRAVYKQLGVNINKVLVPGRITPINELQDLLERALTARIYQDYDVLPRFAEPLDNGLAPEASKAAKANAAQEAAKKRATIAEITAGLKMDRLPEADVLVNALADLSKSADEITGALKKLESFGLEISGNNLVHFLVFTTKNILGKATERTTANSIDERSFKALRTIFAKPDELSKETVNARSVFGPIQKQVETFVQDMRIPERVREVAQKVLDDPKYGLRNIPDRPMNAAARAAYFSALNKILSDGEKTLFRGSVAGFDNVFKRAGGEYDHPGIGAFIQTAYRASRSKESLDDGYFADYIDSLAFENRLISKKDATSLKELDEKQFNRTMLNLADIWRGEGISISLLRSTMKYTETHNPVKYGTKRYTATEMSKGRFLDDVKRSTIALRERMITDVIEEQQILNAVLEKESVIATVETGGGRMRKAMPNPEDAEELRIADKELKHDVIYFDAQGDLTKLINRITTGKNINFPVYRIENGKTIELKPTDPIKAGDFTRYKDLQPLVKVLDPNKPQKFGDLPDWQRAVNEMYFRGLKLSHRRAADALARYRAAKIVDETYPSYAKADAIIASANRIGGETRATVDFRARIMMGEILARADRAVIKADNENTVLQKLPSKLVRDPKALAKRADTMDKHLKALTQKFKSFGFKETNGDYTDVPFLIDDAVNPIFVENPIAFLEKMRTMKVREAGEHAAWKTAIKYLLDMTVTGGKGGEYRDFSDMIRTYVNRGKNVKPGEYDEGLGKVVPTNEEMIQVLEKLDIPIPAREVFTPRIIMNILNRKDVKEIISAEELARAQKQDFIQATQIAAGDEVRAMVESLPAPEIIMNQLMTTLNNEVANLAKNELDIIYLLGLQMAGVSGRQFFLDRAEKFTETVVDALGRTVDVATETVGKKTNRRALLQSWEPETNYTGWKTLLQQLDEMSTKLGYLPDSEERKMFMSKMAMNALRVRDLYLHTHGIYPSVGVKVTHGEEGKLLRIWNMDEADRSKLSQIYLSDYDVMATFNIDEIADLFFTGRETSMPITSMMPAVRLLVSAYDTLPEGKFFTQPQLQGLADTMTDLIYNSVKKVTSTLKGGKNRVTVFDINGDLIVEKIRTIVQNLIQPETVAALHMNHIENASVAHQLLKYKSGKITKPIIDAWERMLTNEFTAEGSRIDQTMELITKEFQKIVGNTELTDDVKIMAILDLNTAMLAKMDYEAVITLREAHGLGEVNGTLSPEAQAILKVQKESGGRRQQKINNLVAQTAISHKDITKAGSSIKIAELSAKGGTMDDAIDVFMDDAANAVKLNWALRFTDKVLTALKYDYGMESLRNMYGGPTRNIVVETAQMADIGNNIAEHYRKIAPNRNVMKEAYDVIRQADVAILERKLQSHQQLLKLEERIRTGGQEASKYNKRMHNKLLADINNMEDLLPSGDPLLMQAVADMWKLLGPIVGGGANSRLARSSITPRWINLQLRELGLGKNRGYINANGDYVPERDAIGFNAHAKSMADVADNWREWELDNPLQAIVNLNNALLQAGKIPEMAADITSQYGVRKNTMTKADARAQGLIEIKPVESLQQGKALLYFMDTTNYYYPYYIAKELGTYSKFLEQIKHMQNNGRLERLLVKFAPIQNFQKVWLTLMRPANYFNNLNGGVWTNFFAGVSNPVAYYRATKMMKYKSINLKRMGIEMDGIDKQLSNFYAQRAKEGVTITPEKDPRNSESMVVKLGNKRVAVQYSDLEKLYNQLGGYVAVTQTREADLLNDTIAIVGAGKRGFLSATAAKYNKGIHWVGTQAALRDNWLRVSLWLDEMAKYGGENLLEAGKAAINKVDRYHPQVQDLSTVNQKWTRHIILFFTWRAKTLGWILSDMLDRPGRYIAPIKAQSNIAQASGVQTESTGDQTALNQPLPGYYQGNLDPQIMGPNGAIFKFSLSNPVTDLLGSTSWLAGFNFNTYEPVDAQVAKFGMDTFDRFAVNSMPLVLSLISDYGINHTTQNGVRLDTAAPGDIIPLAMEDITQRLGFGPYHILAALSFPGIIEKPEFKDMVQEKIGQKAALTFFNWMSGMKLQQVNTIKNIQAGTSELMKEIKGLNELDIR